MTANITIIGSLWFDVSDGQDMAAMASAGTLDLTAFDHMAFPRESQRCTGAGSPTHRWIRKCSGDSRNLIRERKPTADTAL